MTAPTEDEIRARVAALVEAEYQWRPAEVALDSWQYLGNTDHIEPFDAVIQSDHVTDEDYATYSDAMRAGIEARAQRVVDVVRSIWIEAETEAIVAFLAAHPWAPLAEPEPVEA